MEYKIYFTKEAENDLIAIFDYLHDNESDEFANSVLTAIEQKCENLYHFPDRGHYPPELKRISVFEFREVHCKPYRIIYQVISKNVFIHCVLDQRREITDILHDRLVRPGSS